VIKRGKNVKRLIEIVVFFGEKLAKKWVEKATLAEQ
jgi:hypothetical protein